MTLNTNQLSLLQHANMVFGDCCAQQSPSVTDSLLNNSAIRAIYGDKQLIMYNKLHAGQHVCNKKIHKVFMNATIVGNIMSLYNHWSKVNNVMIYNITNFIIWPQYDSATHIMIRNDGCYCDYFHFVSIWNTKDSTNTFLRGFNIKKPKPNKMYNIEVK